MTFVIAVLSIDIKRVEVTSLLLVRNHTQNHFNNINNYNCNLMNSLRTWMIAKYQKDCMNWQIAMKTLNSRLIIALFKINPIRKSQNRVQNARTLKHTELSTL
jgi:hypothetical protein